MNNTPIEPLVEGTRTATIHFAKAAFEIASGIGAMFTGIVRTVRHEDRDGDDDPRGPQKVTVE